MNNSTKRYLKLIALLLIAIIVFLILNHFRVYFGVELIIALAILWGGVKFLRKRDTDFAEQDYDADDEVDAAEEQTEPDVSGTEPANMAETGSEENKDAGTAENDTKAESGE